MKFTRTYNRSSKSRYLTGAGGVAAKLLRRDAIKSMGRETGKNLGRGVCSHNLPDPLETLKLAPALLVRRKQLGVSSVGWLHSSMPQKAIPGRTPQPPKPFALHGTQGPATTSRLGSGCGTSLGRSQRAPAAAPGPCQTGLQPGDRELPKPRKPQGGYLISHPGRAGWQRPLEVRAQPAAQDQGSRPQHAFRGGCVCASEEHLPA